MRNKRVLVLALLLILFVGGAVLFYNVGGMHGMFEFGHGGRIIGGGHREEYHGFGESILPPAILIGILTGIYIVIRVVKRRKTSSRQRNCPICRKPVESNWIKCPYCGNGIIR